MSENSKKVIHWGFWVIGIVTLIWNRQVTLKSFVFFPITFLNVRLKADSDL